MIILFRTQKHAIENERTTTIDLYNHDVQDGIESLGGGYPENCVRRFGNNNLSGKKSHSVHSVLFSSFFYIFCFHRVCLTGHFCVFRMWFLRWHMPLAKLGDLL